MPVETYEDDEEEQEGPRSSFATYLAEGDTLFKQSEFKKALESYSLVWSCFLCFVNQNNVELFNALDIPLQKT